MPQLRSLTVLPLKPSLNTGSFDNYPCKTHTTFWGTYIWPGDSYDPWDPENPRHPMFQRRTSTKSAKAFIKIAEMRNLVYKYISLDDCHAASSGFLMSCKAYYEHGTNELLQICQQCVKEEQARWSKILDCDVRIASPAIFRDLDYAEIVLPARLFLDNADTRYINNLTPNNLTLLETWRPLRLQCTVPMGALLLRRLKFTIYEDGCKCLFSDFQ